MSFCKGYTQGGSNADVIIVDSWIKKLDGVNWQDAYDAIIKDAEVQPPNWDIEGRGGLHSWKERGYIPYLDNDVGGLRTRSVSRTVEVSRLARIRATRDLANTVPVCVQRLLHRANGERHRS